MPFFLLANWKWILPSALALTLGVMLAFSKLEVAALNLAIAEQKIEAGKVLAAETAKSAAADARNAELANKLDTEHALSAANDAARRADFDKRLREARRGSRCGSPAAPPAADSRIGADVAPGSDDGPGGAYFEAGRQLREAALTLQAYAKTCNAWAKEIGR